MNAFNLMPENYRRQRLFYADMRLAIIGLVIVCLAIGGLYIYENKRITEYKSRLNQTSESRNKIEIAKAEMESIRSSKRRLESRYALLKGLKGNISTRELFLAIDNSLSEDIKFQALNFEREGEAVESTEEPEEETTQSSYFIILSESEPTISDTRVDAWRIEASMKIRGRAKSHSALASFMMKLKSQEQIDRVELLRSGGKGYAGSERIEFELLVSIRNLAGKGS